jgi:mono/diheme cytochrome c family protein
VVSRTLWLAGLLICVSSVLRAQGRGPELPPGEGKELAQSVCATACHDATPLLMKRDGESGWRRNVERMVVQKGAQLFPADLETLLRYLSTRLGPGAGGRMQTGVLPPGALGGGAQTANDVQLPEGTGKDVVAARCAVCHDLGRVVSVRRTKQGWEQMTRNMMGRGSQVSAEQIQTIITYLTTHFGKQE